MKLTLSLLAIGSISAIAVGSVVSCSNNSNSNSTSSNTLQTTITGSTFTDISNNWNNSFLSYSKTSNYANWMQNNLEKYATNAPTYFSNLAKAYWTVTGSKPADSSISTSYLPISYNVTGNIKMPDAAILDSDLSQQLSTDSATSSSSSSQDSSSESSSSSNSSSSSSNSNSSSSKSTSSSSTAPGKTSISPVTENIKCDYYISLTNVTLSNFKENNNLFDFTLTWKYSTYSYISMPKLPAFAATGDDSEPAQPTQTFHESNFTVTQTIDGASFASTILGNSINNLLSTNSDVKVNSGWYLESCTSNTFTVPMETETSSKSTSAVLTNLDANTPQSTNNNLTFNGSTKFASPSSSEILNAPIVTTCIKSGITRMSETSLTSIISQMMPEFDKTFTISNPTESGITNNYWLNNFITNGISGYAYVNNSDIITATNSIKNIDSSMLSDLKESTLDFNITFDMTYNMSETTNSTNSETAH